MRTNDPELDVEFLIARHRQRCAVFNALDYIAVYNLNRGVFEPSWEAQSKGWMLVKASKPWRKMLISWLSEYD